MTIDVEFMLGQTQRVDGEPGLVAGDLQTAALASGAPVTVRLSKAPHLLVAGMTGAGKSVLVHDLICQFITGHTPAQVSLVLIDPKRVEFGVYKGLPHLPLNPVYQPQHVEYALGWAASEMYSRFDEMERRGWRDAHPAPWPRLLVVVDELANLMLGGKEFEKPLIDIASMGRAAGVHLLLATQSPRADVVNGLIRANVPTRVALPTLTAADSRIILDAVGAEQLNTPGRLIRLPGQRDLVFAHGRYWKQEDIDRTIGIWHQYGVHRA
jgi:S-DNA-T family DNA segregation ATPase FtsK/SpoIIIE